MDKIFTIDKDMRAVYSYDIKSNSVRNLKIDTPSVINQNFQYCQTESLKLFLVGGGIHTSKGHENLRQCYEIVCTDDSQVAKCVKKDKMKHPRTGHSLCCLRDKFIVATGSRIDDADISRSVEFYNIELNTWFDQPSMNHGRHYHSTCTFQNRWIYAFAGVSHKSKTYFNSIERFDSTMPSA